MKKVCIFFFFLLFIFSCTKKSETNDNEIQENQTEITNTSSKDTLVTTIPALKWLTQKIAGKEFEVISILEPNMNHEQFEPQPNQLKLLENSHVLFTYGTLHFEEMIINSMSDKEKITYVLTDVPHELYLESDHHHDEDDDDDHDSHEEHEHDPHVWFSLEMMPQVALNIKNKLIELYPDKTATFEENYTLFLKELDDFKIKIANEMKNKKDTAFIIYHPTINYFIHDLNVKQYVIEQEGKEPSAQYIKTIIDTAKKENIKTIFIQPQFPKQSAEAIANELTDAKIIVLNADNENIFEILEKFVQALN